MRLPAFLVAAALVACGGSGSGDPDGGSRVPCAAQSECGSDLRRVCEDGYCSAELADPYAQENFRNLVLSLSSQVRLRGPKAFRAWVFYQVRPDGSPVRCADLGPSGALPDPSGFNQTATAVEQQIRTSGDAITTGIFVNGVGRVVAIEVFDAAFNDSPTRIGFGCLESTPAEGTLGVEIKAS